MAPFPQTSPRHGEMCARLLIRLFVRAMLRASPCNISISTRHNAVDAHTKNIECLCRSLKVGDATFDTSESPRVEGSLRTLPTRLWRLFDAVCVWLDTPRVSPACPRFSRRSMPRAAAPPICRPPGAPIRLARRRTLWPGMRALTALSLARGAPMIQTLRWRVP